jgi:hypothetical protein
MEPSHGTPSLPQWSGEQKTDFQKTKKADNDYVENRASFVEKEGPWKRRGTRGTASAMLEAQLPARTQLCLCLASIFLVFATLRAFGPEVGTALGSLATTQGYMRSLVPKAEPAPTQEEAATGPVEATAITPDVQFDNYTLILKGQRIFIQYDTAFCHSIAPYNKYLLPVQENSTLSGCQSPPCGLTSYRKRKLRA